jgi:predicted DNA-binding protein
MTRKPTTIRLPDELIKEAGEIAATTGASKSGTLKRAIEIGLAELRRQFRPPGERGE